MTFSNQWKQLDIEYTIDTKLFLTNQRFYVIQAKQKRRKPYFGRSRHLSLPYRYHVIPFPLVSSHTWDEQITAFQYGLNTVYSCAMERHVPLVKHI